jgi:hypothetical protein
MECQICGTDDAVSPITLLCGECEDHALGHPTKGEVPEAVQLYTDGHITYDEAVSMYENEGGQGWRT